jgi:hypothetical protein
VLSKPSCAPGLHDLPPPRHYREAICDAHDGSDADRRAVEAALAADAGVTLHVHVLTPAELRGVLGDAADAVGARATFVRVRAQTNTLPVDAVVLAAGVSSDGGWAESVTWDALARATREQLPPNHTVKSYATLGNAVMVGTLGLSLLFGVGGDSKSYEVEAPHDEYAAKAPRATALHDALGPATCTRYSTGGDAGHRCEGFFVVDATSYGGVRLEVAVTFRALRDLGKPDPDPSQRCEVTSTSTVPLGPAHTLAQATEEMFGPLPRRLVDIAR